MIFVSHEIVLILDFGGQYNQLIARRVRDMGIYCEIIPWRKATVETIKEKNPSNPQAKQKKQKLSGFCFALKIYC